MQDLTALNAAQEQPMSLQMLIRTRLKLARAALMWNGADELSSAVERSSAQIERL
jgi:hypothetical protein